MPSFYAQSWLAVHYGMVENRDFGRQIVQYINDINRLVPQEEAARKNFGEPGYADKLLRDYSRQQRMSSGAMDLGEAPPVTLPEGKPLDDTDTLAILADLLLEIRVAPDRVRPLVESLGRRDPNPARAAILAARLARLEDDNAAFDAAISKAESSLAPNDWEQRRELATVLLNGALENNPMSKRMSQDRDRDLKRSLNWFAEAINHNNQDVEALWGYGTAATSLGKNLDVAEQALTLAYQRAPASADIAVSLADLKNRQDKPDEAIPYLQDAIRYATDLGTRRWAADTLNRTREYIAERNKVDAENKKNREAYERQLADYEKKYGRVKKKQ
jgi:tetratricopeptide (TPR) repeat protein